MNLALTARADCHGKPVSLPENPSMARSGVIESFQLTWVTSKGLPSAFQGPNFPTSLHHSAGHNLRGVTLIVQCPLHTSSDKPICWPRRSEFDSLAGGPLACPPTGGIPNGSSGSNPGMLGESTLAKDSTSPGPMVAITGLPLLGPRTILVSKPLLNHWRQAHSPFR